MEPIVGLVVVALAGAVGGTLTGLLPSLHVNTLAIVLVATAPTVFPLFAIVGLDTFEPAYYGAALVLAISISHTFVNIVPAAYLGAPDDTSAMNVLPAHRMLLRGNGYRAVRLSAFASFWALVVGLALVFPFKQLMGEPVNLFEVVRAWLPWIVLVAAVLLILSETNTMGPEGWSNRARRWLARAAAAVLFLLAGAYGLVINRVALQSIVPVPPTPLLPALSGLFGAATIITSAVSTPRVPHQFLRLHDDNLKAREASVGLGIGVLAGATMSVLPGLTSASATGLVASIRKAGDAATIVSLSSVNTANALFNLAMLYLFLKTRSGAVIAIEAILPIEAWRTEAPPALVLLLFVALVAGLASLGATIVLGRVFVRRLQRVPYRGLLYFVLAWMTITVFAFTGLTGLLVFATGCAIGLLPVRLGIRRVCLTGVLLVPILTFFWF